MVDQPVLTAVRTYLEALRDSGLEVSFGVVFGSYARQSAERWSDIDLLVVSPRFDGPRLRSDIQQLWRMAARTDSRIEPVPCGDRQWLADDASAIIEIARREGQRVSLAEAA